MSVAVVVPFRGGCRYREAAWAWVRRMYEHRGYEVIEAPAPAGEWCKAAAVNPVVATCSAEIIVQADADVWSEGLRDAIAAVEAGAPWAIPHGLVHRLTEESTEDVMRGADWRSQQLEQPSYSGIPAGGILVARREVLHSIPLDSRFTGWG